MPNIPERSKQGVPVILFAGIFGGIIVSDALGWMTALIVTPTAILGTHLFFSMERKEVSRQIGRYLRDFIVVFTVAVAVLTWQETRDPTVWMYGGGGLQVLVVSLMYGAFLAGIPSIVDAWKAFRAEGHEPETTATSTPSGTGARVGASSPETDAFSFREDRFADRPREEPQQEHPRPRSPRSAQDSYSISDVMAEAKRWASQVSDEKAESTAEKWERMAAKGALDAFRQDVALAAADLLRERLKGMANRPTPLLASDDEVLQITKQK